MDVGIPQICTGQGEYFWFLTSGKISSLQWVEVFDPCWPLFLYNSPRLFLCDSGEHLAHCFPWEAFSHMHHSVFMHSDTNNVSLLPVPTELLFSCSKPSAPAQLPLLLVTEHRESCTLKGWLFTQLPSQRQGGNMPNPGVTVGKTIKNRENLGFTVPLTWCFTHIPAPHSPARTNCFWPEPLLTKAGCSWTFLSDRCSQKQMATNLKFPPLSCYSANSSHQFI